MDTHGARVNVHPCNALAHIVHHCVLRACRVDSAQLVTVADVTFVDRQWPHPARDSKASGVSARLDKACHLVCHARIRVAQLPATAYLVTILFR